MAQPDTFKNAEGKEVKIFQVGFAGINLGRVDFYFERGKNRKTSLASSLQVNSNFDDMI